MMERKSVDAFEIGFERRKVYLGKFRWEIYNGVRERKAGLTICE